MKTIASHTCFGDDRHEALKNCTANMLTTISAYTVSSRNQFLEITSFQATIDIKKSAIITATATSELNSKLSIVLSVNIYNSLLFLAYEVQTSL